MRVGHERGSSDWGGFPPLPIAQEQALRLVGRTGEGMDFGILASRHSFNRGQTRMSSFGAAALCFQILIDPLMGTAFRIGVRDLAFLDSFH